MKEKVPLGNPFIGEPRGGRPTKGGGQKASSCGHCPSTLSQRCGGCAKEVDSGGESKKGGRRWPTGHRSLADRPFLASNQSVFSSSTLSCAYHTRSTDQKHQKKSKFLSSFSNVLFIYF
jgi:hypothetical protein